MNRTSRTARRRVSPREGALRISWMTDSHAWSAVDNDPDHPDAINTSRYYFTVGEKIEQFVEQVNADQPHGVIHTGDMVDRGREHEFFLSKWGQLDPTLNQAVVPGNHDFAFPLVTGVTRHDTLAADMGYDGKPMNAGSKFNQSVTFSGNGVSARLIMMDTNIQSDGLHLNTSVGKLSEDALTWIEGEIASSPEDIILIASHHGPQMWSHTQSYFQPDAAQALRDIVDAEVAVRPNRKIKSLFGHHHIQSSVMLWDSLGPNLPGFLAPATVELNPSSYINLLVSPEGRVSWEMKSTQYPNS